MNDSLPIKTPASNRKIRRGSSEQTRKNLAFSNTISLLPILAVMALSICCAAPWYFASTPWAAQSWLVLSGIVSLAVLAIETGFRFTTRGVGSSLSVPSLSICLFIAAGYAYIQSIPLYESVPTQSIAAPFTIRIQRWLLGAPDNLLDTRFGIRSAPESVGKSVVEAENVEDSEKRNASMREEPFWLAISIEPLHTRAAIGSLVLAASMVWMGAVCFTSPKWQISLLIVVTLLGVTIGIVGLAHLLSWKNVNWLGLSSVSSFATFVSKNSAGGFLNVCLSAALGLAAWTFIKKHNPNDYFDIPSENPIAEFFRRIEMGFAKLTTPQIASVLAVAFILAAVACTASRGATIGGMAACIVVLLLSSRQDRGAGRLIFALCVVALGLALIFFFEFDERISKRFEELMRVQSESKSGRSYIWGVAMTAFSCFFLTGSGLGTFHYAYIPFQTPTTSGWYYHAESLIAQTMVEFGWIGVCLILFVVFQMIRCVVTLAAPQKRATSAQRQLKSPASRSPQYGPAYVVGLSLLVSQGIHSLVDFALIVPAVFIPASLLAGMVCAMADTRRKLLLESIAQSNSPTSEQSLPHAGPLRSSPMISNASTFIEPRSGKERLREPETSLRRQSSPSSDDSRRRSRRSGSRSWDTSEMESIVEQQVVWQHLTYRNTSRLALTCSMTIGLIAIALMASSLTPIDAMERCDKMAEWLTAHEKLPRDKRIASPSSHLVGLWDSTKLPIEQASSALRMIGDSVLYEFRCERFDELEREASGRRKVSWDETSPLLMNALLNGLVDVNGDSTVKKTQSDLVGGEKQLARWDKAYELTTKGRQVCPLDWRLSWNQVLLERGLPRGTQLRHLELAGILSKHRAENCFQIGVLANEAGEYKMALDHFRQSLLLSTGYAVRVASILALKNADGDIPLDIFPNDFDSLRSIASAPFSVDRFPKSNEFLWEKIKLIATEIPTNEPRRWLWLADIAVHEGETETELDCLKQVVSMQPMNRALRMRWAKRLADLDQMDEAIQQAEFCQTLEPDDQRVNESIRLWKDKRNALR